MRMNHCDTFTFGMAITLTVSPRNNSLVPPKLFVLSPLQHQGAEETVGDNLDVCLAIGFRPRVGDMVLTTQNRSSTWKTSEAVLSTQEKTYFYAKFPDDPIDSCELHGVVAQKQPPPTPGTCVTARPPAADTRPTTSPVDKVQHQNPGPTPSPSEETVVDLHPDGALLNFNLLLMNGVRLVFTKTLAFNTIFTIRALLF